MSRANPYIKDVMIDCQGEWGRGRESKKAVVSVSVSLRFMEPLTLMGMSIRPRSTPAEPAVAIAN